MGKVRVNIISSTKEGYNASSAEQFILGGKIAGVCYMQGEYKDEKVSGTKSGTDRANMTAQNGHHSVFDHCYKTVEIQGVSKLMAMVLNSLGWYTTSEKSGRYTSMCPESGIGKEMYEKWFEIFKERVADCIKYKATEKEIEKLANENARYVLSVMTPTTLVYTTSLRQWSYLYDWLEELENRISYFIFYIKEHGENGWMYTVSEFETLKSECKELRELLKKLNIATDKIKDNRHRDIEFISLASEVDKDTYFGDVYKAVYKGSLVQLAQAQRHRPLKHNMTINIKDMEFYIPTMIKGTNYVTEWTSDMKKIVRAGIIPNATMVTITERGCTEDFLLKCTERLCSRAMLEIQDQTKSTLSKMLGRGSSVGDKVKKKLECFTDGNGNIVPKCRAFGYTCCEGCKHPKEDVLKRMV